MGHMEAWGWESESEEEYEEEEDNTRDYIFQDSETFLAALELYNRQGCTFLEKTDDSIVFPRTGWKVSYEWECKTVYGKYSVRCGSCGTNLHSDPDDPEYYLFDKFHRSDKRCLGCMDTLLYDTFGEDKADILSKLNALRNEQPRNLVSRYQERYIDYPVFLKHCRDNNEEAFEDIQVQMANRVNEAMDAACNGSNMGSH